MENIIYNDLIKFAIEEAMLPKRTVLNQESGLYEELGLTGADAIEFIIAYGKKFNVDVSNFMAADYFAAEGMNFFEGNGGKKALTIGDLLKGVEHSKLDEEVLKK